MNSVQKSLLPLLNLPTFVDLADLVTQVRVGDVAVQHVKVGSWSFEAFSKVVIVLGQLMMESFLFRIINITKPRQDVLFELLILHQLQLFLLGVQPLIKSISRALGSIVIINTPPYSRSPSLFVRPDVL
mmetsp:Transcript_22967/g.35444  ORF Transcript_22967/g.35444 Transcript_22967/m.35444 type:complete len:129 (+) Transcript_22967:144-530(+)